MSIVSQAACYNPLKTMATCPRCLGALSDGHRCKPIWIKRFLRQVKWTAIGVAFGAFVQILVMPHLVPVLGPIIGGLIFLGASEALKD
jgi:hypothetical protein